MLGLGVVLLGIASRHWRGASSDESPGVDRLRRGFLIALDAQVLLGIGLYALLSPLPRAGLSDIGGAMADPVLRFYSIEHAFGMLLGAAVAHVGSLLARRRDGTRRHRALALTLGLWLLITLASVPWPGLPYGRPLLRWP